MLVALAAMLCFGVAGQSSTGVAVADEPSSGLADHSAELLKAMKNLKDDGFPQIDDERLRQSDLCTSKQEENASGNQCAGKRKASAKKRLDAVDKAIAEGMNDEDEKRLTRVTPYEMRSDVGVAPETPDIPPARGAALDACGFFVELNGAYCDDLTSCDIPKKAGSMTQRGLEDYCRAKAGHSLSGRLSTYKDSNLSDMELDVKAAAVLAYELDGKESLKDRQDADKAEAIASEMWDMMGWTVSR